MVRYPMLHVFALIFIISSSEAKNNVDKNGYIIYCPCMGRFGNQVDQFFGTLNFAKTLNRTLVLPTWIKYDLFSDKPIFVPFDHYFMLEPLNVFYKVMLIKDFMHLAPKAWPLSKRYTFCHSSRNFESKGYPNDCNPKEGSPFGPFWDNVDVNFTAGSRFYSPLQFYPATSEDNLFELKKLKFLWDTKFPPPDYPVLAFVGAPGSFPVKISDVHLHGLLIWSQQISQMVDKHFFDLYGVRRYEYIGLHLRNGLDWKLTCQHVGQTDQLFSSSQCLGENNEFGQLTAQICFPTQELIVSQLRNVLQNSPNITNIFIASDKNHMILFLQANFKDMNIYKLESEDPQLDLYILARAYHFIGNCVSSFSAFVKRERDIENLPTSFWGVHHLTRAINLFHQEL
ncbi:unnamed protein product [Gordionus sp. m RMFG-2023]|uniref:GDP-fucose protein O-fucosyltransferase 1-like n=1 Tax=Gordionus sp. m RMFG-2023 TaxID=3053472 RepID=UPI0030E46C34